MIRCSSAACNLQRINRSSASPRALVHTALRLARDGAAPVDPLGRLVNVDVAGPGIDQAPSAAPGVLQYMHAFSGGEPELYCRTGDDHGIADHSRSRSRLGMPPLFLDVYGVQQDPRSVRHVAARRNGASRCQQESEPERQACLLPTFF
jgi:hypothetical protein